MTVLHNRPFVRPFGRARLAAAVVAAAALWLPGCREARRPELVSQTTGAPAAAPAEPQQRRLAAAPSRPRVVVLGDSIAAGLGLPTDQAFPAIVQRRIDAAGLAFEVVNAGVSGDTSAGGLRRLDWALEGDVRVLVLELGANDGLRGLPVDEMTRNLGDDHRAGAGARHRGDACGHGSAAELRAATTRRRSARCSASWRASTTRRSCRSCWRASPASPRSTSATASIPTPRARAWSPTPCGRVLEPLLVPAASS